MLATVRALLTLGICHPAGIYLLWWWLLLIAVLEDPIFSADPVFGPVDGEAAAERATPGH
jgi:hypothetical protein